MSFDEQQRAAVVADHPNILLCAGAGSGKTTTLVGRVLYLVASGVDPTEILCLTFTRAAAEEMGDRLRREAAEARIRRVERVYVSTFHSWAASMLRRYGAGLVRPDFSIFDEDDMADAVCFAAAEVDPKFKRGETAVGRRKQAATKRREPLVMDRCMKHLRDAGAMSFDMIEATMARLLGTDGAKPLRERWSHVLVDEYQDTSIGQQQILDLLAPKHIFRVGDHAQSIYRFRGAHVDAFVALMQDPTCLVLSITTNYRSREAIVEMANHVASRMTVPGLAQVAVRTARLPCLVELAQPSDRTDAVAQIVDMVEDGAAYHGATGVAVLAPQWRHLEQIGEALQDRGIPVRYLRKVREVWDHEGARRLVALLRGVRNLDDHLSWWQAFQPGPAARSAWNAKRAAALKRYTAFAAELDGWADGAPHAGGLRFTVQLGWTGATPVLDVLRDNAVALARHYVEEARFTRAEEVDAFLVAVRTWVEGRWREGAEELVSVDAFLEWHGARHLVGLGRDGEEEEEEEKVTLTTIHGAKGLEWSLVIGLAEEGYLPKADADGETLEESRRLLYVMVTRARDELTLVAGQHRGTSRLLKELDTDG